MTQVNLARAKSAFSEYASRAAYANERITITKRGKPFVALISIEDLEFLERIKAGTPEDGLLGAVGRASELHGVSLKAMEEYRRRGEDVGRNVEL